MTEKIKCKLTYNHFNKDCSEEVFLDVNNFEQEGESMIERFNDEEHRRRRIKPDYLMDIRKFVSVEKLNERIHHCILEKRNIISQKDKRGYYDFLECKRCFRVLKRYTLETPINLICEPSKVCKRCRKIFKTDKGINNHKELKKCKKHYLV